LRAALVVVQSRTRPHDRVRGARRIASNPAVRVWKFFILVVLPLHACANDLLWEKLRTEPDLVVLMRHTQPAGGNPLTWDESGNCVGEAMLTAEGKAHARKIGEEFARRGIKPAVITSPMCRCRDSARIAFGAVFVTDAALREIASADTERANVFERKAQSLIGARRGASPVVFVSHRPNIDLLSLELVAEGELLVTRANAKGELDVLGRINVQP
jgi:phosphohistidine phosphatase SixA